LERNSEARHIFDLVGLLEREVVDTEADLRQWLSTPASREKLLAIPFIGPKTADYLKILVGLPVAAMDRHLLGFLELAGLGKLRYPVGQDIVHRTADLMQLNRSHLDHSIWRYLSGSKASAVDGVPLGGQPAAFVSQVPHHRTGQCLSEELCEILDERSNGLQLSGVQ